MTTNHKQYKGFTLVEIIVVLVIIAILVALTLPALTGYIENARDKNAMSETRTYLSAAQSISTELYGLGYSKARVERYLFKGERGTGAGSIPASYTKTVASVTGVDYFKNYELFDTINWGRDSMTIDLLIFRTSNGRRVKYEAGTMTVDPDFVPAKKP